jgi:serine protease Do
LIKYGKTRRGWLGVRIQKVTDEIAESLGLKKAEGAMVASVTDNSPAAKGGIKAGDVILKFNNRDVKEMRSLPKIVAETEIDKNVNVEVWRDRKKVTTQVDVGELDEEEVAKTSSGETGDGGKDEELKITDLGISVGNLNANTRKRFNLKKKSKGVVVVDVDKDGVATEKGIKVGDVIVEVSQNEVVSPKEVKKRIEDVKSSGRKSVLLLIEGQAGLRFVALRLTKK